MSRLSFRAKLLLAMLLVVAGGGFTTLVVTQQRVQQTFDRVYRQQFLGQIEYFATLQESRLETTRDQCLKLVQSEAVIAALARAEPDVAALYNLASAEFNEGGPQRPGQRGAAGPPRRNRVSFHRFVDAQGKPLLPAEGQGGRRFTTAMRSRIENQAQYFSSAIAAPATQQIAYLAVEQETNELGGVRFGSLRSRASVLQGAIEDRPPVFQEIIVTKVRSSDGAQTLGALILGLPTALKYVAKHYLVAYAMFVMLLLVFSPSGIIGFFEKRFTAARKTDPPPAPTAEVKVA